MLDEDNLYLLDAYHFSLKNKRGKWYAETKIEGRTVGIHRIVMGVHDQSGKILVDHVDQDGLNNRRVNLRLANNRQNACNVAPRIGCSSVYEGVDSHRDRWRARATIAGREKHLGHFDTEREAAVAYDYAVLHEYGEFALTNFIPHAEWASEMRSQKAA